MRSITFYNTTKDAVLGDAIRVADTPRTRSVGLLNDQSLKPGEGLWIIPSEAIHTFWMKFPIDVIFLDKKKRVTKVVHALKPSRIAFSLRAHSVLELPSGVAEKTGAERGDQLEIREGEPPPF